jgi:hypothetical protein
MERMRAEIEKAYIESNQFTLQRYKLKELVASLPEQAALSLIRHCFECNYNESVTISKALLVEDKPSTFDVLSNAVVLR